MHSPPPTWNRASPALRALTQEPEPGKLPPVAPKTGRAVLGGCCVAVVIVMTLDQLGPGNEFVITRVIAHGEIRTRLVDMGFIGGAHGTVLRKALLGDPIELKLGAYLVSLRLEEARSIHVKDG